MRKILGSILFACLAVVPLMAQDDKVQDDSLVRMSLRVSSTGPDSRISVDRGQRERLKVGDRVLLYPRNGRTYRGTVIQVGDRMAVVELQDVNFVPPVGTRGEVLVPKSRLPERKPVPAPIVPDATKPKPDPKQSPEQPKAESEQKAAPEHQPWQNKDENYAKGKPLLAGDRAVRPENRDPRLTGRVYSIGDLTRTRGNDFENSLLRAGTELEYENPFGRGGGIKLDTEFNLKTEAGDKRGVDLLPRELSYYWGGTRFSDTRWELGRFLQHGIPEFGIVDGLEWTRRRSNHHRYGFSFGLQPELNEDFDTGEDLALAGYYLWNDSEQEDFTVSTGFMKTLHNGKADRDLLINKIDYYNPDGWDFHGTMWTDFYYGSDDFKPFLEVTTAVVSTGRRWLDGSGVNLSYYHEAFPEVRRNEFVSALNPNELFGNHQDRVRLAWWEYQDDGDRLHADLTGWADDGATGGAFELGLDMRDFIFDRSRTDVTPFISEGQFATVIGARLIFTSFVDNGYWNLFYEVANHHQKHFPQGQDDVVQHRARLDRTYHLGSGWDFSGYVQLDTFDSDLAWTLGFFVQRSF